MPQVPEFGVIAEGESDFSPALVANTPVQRNFKRDMPWTKYPWRDELFVDNTQGTGILTLRILTGVSMFTRRVGVGGTLTFKNQGPIYGYTLASTTGIAADIATVYENGGLNIPG